MLGAYVVYKITYPNGKIYVGKAKSRSINYFGSADPGAIERDHTRKQLRDFTVRREILWESQTCTNRELLVKEAEFIVKLRSNDPAIGYNRVPLLVDESGG